LERPEDLQAAAAAALQVIGAGGVVLIPTETFYGLAADPRSAAGVARVYALKGRPRVLALPVLCADWEQVEELVAVEERLRARLELVWPGPTTVVLPARARLACAPADTLAVRIPGLEVLRRLLAVTGPLTGTSANRHGRAPARRAASALAALHGEPDLTLDGGTTPGGSPSTLVDLTVEPARVLRGGPQPWQVSE
jgi:L-threonylcarbamoyladenylate synthase